MRVWLKCDDGSRFQPSLLLPFAERVFGDLFPDGYPGEVLLCGGAFKPILQRGLSIADLDLWVRDAEAREQLCSALVGLGAVLLEDFRPYCIKFELRGRVIEVAYGDAASGRLQDVTDQFDLALCAVGARYVHGHVTEVFASAECSQAIRDRKVMVQESCFHLLRTCKVSRLLSALHRMKQQAAQFGYEVDADHERLLWHLYWEVFTEAEREAAREFYLEAVCRYKGQRDEGLIRRAFGQPDGIGVLGVRSESTGTPV